MILNGEKFSIKVSDVLALRPAVQAYLSKEDFSDVCPQLIALLDSISEQDPDSEITKAILFKLIPIYAYIQTIPSRPATLKFHEDGYDSDARGESGQSSSYLASRLYDVLKPCMQLIINSDYPNETSLKLYTLMYKNNIPLTTEVLHFLQRVSNLCYANRILFHFDDTQENLSEALLLFVLEHPQLEEIDLLLFNKQIHPISFKTLCQLLMHPDIKAISEVLKICTDTNKYLLDSIFFEKIVAAKDTKKAWSEFLEEQTNHIETETIEPRDVTGRFVTERSGPELKDRFAAKTITAGLRKALHARHFRRFCLFHLEGHNTWDNTLTIPKGFEHLLPIDAVTPVIKSITHVSHQHIPTILHAGKIHPKDVTGFNGVGTGEDTARGDSKIVCFSATAHTYEQPSSVLELNVKDLLEPSTGNLASSVFFKFCDWPKLRFMTKTDYFRVSNNVSVNIEVDRNLEIFWNFCLEGHRMLSVKLPHEYYIYNGYEGLDAYITFFIFKVTEKLPKLMKERIYDDFDKIEPNVLVKNFQSLFFEFFNYAEFDFTATVNLTLSAIKSLTVDDLYVDFDEIRTAIEDDNLDFFVRLFSILTMKKVFQQSYFLIADILSEAEKFGAEKVSIYIKSHFSSTLNLPTMVAEIKRDTEDTSPTSNLLSDTKVQEQLTCSAVTPMQLKNFIKMLKRRPAMLEGFMNEHKTHVIEFLSEMYFIFSRISGVSEIGLQAAIKQDIIDNELFRKLLSDKTNCQILLYLAALNKNSFSLDEMIRTHLSNPLFSDRNTFTGTRVRIFFSGICNGGAPSLYQSLIADILSIVPPMMLFVPNNSNNRDDNESYDVRRVWESVHFYQQLYDQLKVLAHEHNYHFEPCKEPYTLLGEPYVSDNWAHYSLRFQSIIYLCSGRQSIDQLGNNLKDITADRVLDERLFLKGYFTHFCLDPAHLRSVLNNNYGDFRGKLFNLIERLAGSDAANPNQQPFNLRVLGIQLFYRLKLLEYKLEMEHQIAIQAHPSTRETSTDNADSISLPAHHSSALLTNAAHQHAIETEDDSADELMSPFANSQFRFV